MEYYAALCKSEVISFEGNNLELGTACGKLFAVSAMVITDPGDSDILESIWNLIIYWKLVYYRYQSGYSTFVIASSYSSQIYRKRKSQ